MGPSQTEGKGAKAPYFKAVWADTIKETKLDWLWKGRYAKGKLGSLLGDPGEGKTTILTSVIADLTRGRALPGDVAKAPVNCWYMSSEDAADDTLVPMLKNHGADMGRVLITDEFREMNRAGLAFVKRTIKEREIGLLVIDSLTTWMGGETDANSFNQTAAWLQPFKGIAQETGCAIVFIRHRRKTNGSKDNPLYSGLGSMAQTALFRTELSVGKQDGKRYLRRTKGNVGKDPEELLFYEIESVRANELGRLRWAGVKPVSVIVTTKPKKLGKAMAFLQRKLGDWPKEPNKLFEAALKKRISEATLTRAKKELGVLSYQLPGAANDWRWELSRQLH